MLYLPSKAVGSGCFQGLQRLLKLFYTRFPLLLRVWVVAVQVEVRKSGKRKKYAHIKGKIRISEILPDLSVQQALFTIPPCSSHEYM